MNGFRLAIAALVLFLVVLFIDVLLGHLIRGFYWVFLYWLLLFGSWLIIPPAYLAARWTLRDGSTLLGSSLMLWAFEDTLYYFLRGFPPFNPFPEHPGTYPLTSGWYQVWFMILSRVIAGFIVLMLVKLNQDWGSEPVRVSFSEEEIQWILKVAAIIAAGSIAFAAWYQLYSKAGFGGEVLFEVDLSYKSEPYKEMVYQGVLVKTMDVHAGYERYVLVRSHLNLNDISLNRAKSEIISHYLGKEVEILGKLITVQEIRELIPGRIRRKGGPEA